MALIAPVKDGKIQESSASSNSLKDAKSDKTGTSKIDSEAFLTLLVAEMQNQDPLEPTSNTEWISQYATFTQVSEVQAIGDAMESMKADGLVGRTVIMKVTDSSGNTDEITGQVEYVTYEEGKAYLSIDGELYAASDLSTVVGEEYMVATEKAESFMDVFKKLPPVADLTLDYEKGLQGLLDEYDSMTAYEKGFLPDDVKNSLEEYRGALNIMKAAADKVAQANAAKAKEAEAAAKAAEEEKTAEEQRIAKEKAEAEAEAVKAEQEAKTQAAIEKAVAEALDKARNESGSTSSDNESTQTVNDSTVTETEAETVTESTGTAQTSDTGSTSATENTGAEETTGSAEETEVVTGNSAAEEATASGASDEGTDGGESGSSSGDERNEAPRDIVP